MKRAVWLVFVVGCRFELPQALPVGIDAPPVDVQVPVDVPVDGPGCPADFAPLAGGPPGHVYRMVPQNGIWSVQFDFCKGTSPPAYLAVPNDATELMNLYALATGLIWVGIDDRVTEGTYVSAETGAPATFLPWETGQPDEAPGDGDCVGSNTPTAITDLHCTFTFAAVCECNP